MNARILSRAVVAALAFSGTSFAQAPDSISNLKLWLDAQDPLTVQTAGGFVTQWDDKSGSGNHATQLDPARQPLLSPAAMNGFPAIRLNDFTSLPGNDGLNINESLTVGRPYTAFIVDQYWDSAFGGRTLQGRDTNWLLGKWGFGSGQTGHFTLDWVAVAGGIPAQNFVPVASTGIGGMSESYWNVDGRPMGRNGATGNPGRLQIGFGGLGGGFDEPSHADVGEVLVYDRVLDDREIRVVSNHLATKWNLARPFQRQYASQTVHFTGADAGEGLDFNGNFKYALTTDPVATPTIGNATFSNIVGAPGVAHTSEYFIQNWTAPNYGGSPDDIALSTVTRSIRWTDPFNGGTSDVHTTSLDNLTPGRVYKMQLIFQEGCCGRNFAVKVNGDVIRDDFQEAGIGSPASGWNAGPTAGSALVFNFVATGPTLSLELAAPNPVGADRNPILSALTLEDVGNPGIVTSGPILNASSLDLSGSFLYALDFANGVAGAPKPGGNRTVNGLIFKAAESTSGAFTYAENFLAYQFPDLGATPDDDELEDILSSIRWEATTSDAEALAVDLTGLTIGQDYKLQLLFGDDTTNNRHFDIVIDGVQIANNFGANDTGSSNAFWAYEFTAQEEELNILLSGGSSPNSDHNPLLSGLTLENVSVPEPGSAALLLAGVTAIGLRRRNRASRAG